MNAVRNNPRSPFRPLPRGADILVAVRRSIRVGRHAGRPLEELGIVPDERHYMTKRDILNRNDDLIKRAGRILMRKPAYALSADPFKLKDGSHGIAVRATSKNQQRDRSTSISRLDVYVNGRPCKSIDAQDGSIRARITTPGTKQNGNAELRLEAYDGANNLVAVARHGL